MNDHDPTAEFQGLDTIQVLVEEFDQQWRSGRGPRIEDYLPRIDAGRRGELLEKLIVAEVQLRRSAGDTVSPEEYETRFTEDSDRVSRAFTMADVPIEAHGAAQLETRSFIGPDPDGTADLTPRSPGGQRPGDAPGQLGRYRIEKRLGKGGFGDVLLGYDEQLHRQVAIKVASQVVDAHAADGYLAEARTVATLDHPHIVPVYDVGRDERGQVYVVSRLIDGSDLATQLKARRPLPRQAVELAATLADALHYAHGKGLVHRDIKPGNILLDRQGAAYVCDFGLALREEQYGQGPALAGTPAYMSPEQARGEGHLVDGRSDIYSLGVVLYQLLTGRRPFAADNVMELLRRVAHDEPKPPRQIDDRIAPELERITLKCLAKRASDRYVTAADMAEDLRAFLAGKTDGQRHDIKIVPKGLRSFDAGDSDFFLELLPGPRDRHGLPDSIGFWKRRLEERDLGQTFRVGLMYGPSGCGKSSLVKAGLLPRLAENVRPVHIEAAAGETELRLLAGLREACPELPADISLKDAVAQLRQGRTTRAARKVVLIIDQFEQWLHARNEYAATELADALRQCDGGNVQAVVMVRDDFWMAVSRLFRDIDSPLVERQNGAPVDLFDLLHARKVLAEFGRAFGRLPENLGQLNGEQERFLDDAVAGLASDGKVISVRLALFGQMVKGKSWTPGTLKQLGGSSGVGVAFLQETFNASSAPPAHRHHQQAARAVLKELLPGEGTDIKGHWRSRAELLEACGYASRPRDFDQLLRMLDTDLRLITPTEIEAAAEQPGKQAPAGEAEGGFHYQLTHDYLVPALREWLTRQQKETRRGRAELRLEERSALWSAKPETRQLPGLREYAAIRTLTDKSKWTEPQRKMMDKAGRLHLIRLATALCVGLVLGWAGYEVNGRFRARALVENLLSAKEEAVLDIVKQLEPYRWWASSLLQQHLAAAPQENAEQQRRQLHARIALLPEDPSQADLIRQALLAETTPYSYVGVLRDALSPPPASSANTQLVKEFRADFASQDPEQRFRAGLVLATYDAPAADRPAGSPSNWTEDDLRFLARQLVAANPEHQPRLRQYLRPLAGDLLPPLETLFADTRLPESQQLGAANAVADYAAQDAARLTRLLSAATPAQYTILYARLRERGAGVGNETLLELASREPAEDLPVGQRVALGQQRAGAAITLLRRGAREEIFNILRVRDDPESLTQFVHRCRDREVDPAALLECLDQADQLRLAAAGEARQREDRVLFALLLALGEFAWDDLPPDGRQGLIDRLAAWHADDPSSAIHGASGWLLRQWGQREIADKVAHTPVPYSPERQWYTLKITATSGDVSEDRAKERSTFLTFIVIPAGEYEIGSPADEPGRDGIEARHMVRITRPFALLDREVTWADAAIFNSRMAGQMRQSVERQAGFATGDDDPWVIPTWYDSVRFCRWLTRQAGLGEDDQAYADPQTLDKSKYPADPNPEAGGMPRNWPLLGLGRPGFRLPTEAEWEAACRAGMRTAWSFGGDVQLLGHYGWFVDNSQNRTHPVRTRRPNPSGLFDMHGSAYEWCHDWYEGGYDHPHAIDWMGPDSGLYRVSRGGSWYDSAGNCRSSYRIRVDPADRSDYMGFRLAAAPSSQGPEARASGADSAGR